MSRYTTILEKMTKIFNDEEIPAILRKMDENKDLPMDILTVALEEFSPKGNEWIAEISFLPLANGADNTAYVSVAITLNNELTAQASNNVAWLISRFNFYAPYGAFSVSEDGAVLAYKLCTPVVDNGNDDDLFAALDSTVSHAFDFADNFGGLVEAVMEGDITAEAAMNQLLGRD